MVGVTMKYTHWRDARSIPMTGTLPFYAILGCHASGASVLAGICCHLGLHLGNKFAGPRGKAPIHGGEAGGLRDLFTATAPVPVTEMRLERQEILRRLRRWINLRRHEAFHKGTLAAGKCPQLATAREELVGICGDQLRLVICQRDLNDAIDDLCRRTPGEPREPMARHQRWISDCILELREQVSAERQRLFHLEDILADPVSTVGRLIDFLGIDPGQERVRKAVGFILTPQ